MSRIRDFRKGDGEALADLHRRAILATPESFYTLEERESWASGLRAESYRPETDGSMQVAVDEHDFAIAFCHSHADQVVGLYVHPDWQGRGIGAALLARAEQQIGARGHRQIRIKSAVSAVPFYASHGYHVTGRTPFQSRGGLLLAAALLEKPLP